MPNNSNLSFLQYPIESSNFKLSKPFERFLKDVAKFTSSEEDTIANFIRAFILDGNVIKWTYNSVAKTYIANLAYNATNLKITASQLNTIQNINSEASPTFAGLTLTSFSGIIKATAGVLSGGATTTDLTEGTNLYYTTERVDDRVDSLIIAGTGITKVYDDVANTLTLSTNNAETITTTTSATYTITDANSILLCDTASNAITVNLPTAIGRQGKIYKIKCINAANNVTIDGNGTQTIDGNLTFILTFLDALTIVSDNSNWFIL
jgi:hypothetical protein